VSGDCRGSRSPLNTFPGLLSERPRSGLEIPTEPADRLRRRYQKLERRTNKRDRSRTMFVPGRAELRVDINIYPRNGFCRHSAHCGEIDNVSDGQRERIQSPRNVERPIKSAITTGIAMPQSSTKSQLTNPHTGKNVPDILGPSNTTPQSRRTSLKSSEGSSPGSRQPQMPRTLNGNPTDGHERWLRF